MNDLCFMRRVLDDCALHHSVSESSLTQLGYLSFNNPAVALSVFIVLNLKRKEKWYYNFDTDNYHMSTKGFYDVLDYFKLGLVREGDDLASAQKIVEAFFLRMLCRFSLKKYNTVGPFLDVIISFLHVRELSRLSLCFNSLSSVQDVEMDYASRQGCGLGCVIA